jgi:hypothetical protein
MAVSEAARGERNRMMVAEFREKFGAPQNHLSYSALAEKIGKKHGVGRSQSLEIIRAGVKIEKSSSRNRGSEKAARW